MVDPELDPHEARRIRTALERLEERLHQVPAGLHLTGAPADRAALTRASLPKAAALLWEAYDGLELAGGEARIFALDQLGAEISGERVIGERGRDTFVLPTDPWEDGADVVSIDEEGERRPEASSVAHLVLGIVAEASVLYDEQAEFRDELFDEMGQLLPAAQRRLLRRRLDVDPDAPAPRLELARLLRDADEISAARREFDLVLRRSPGWALARYELGRTLRAMGREQAAADAFGRAAEDAPDPESAAYYWAWRATVGPNREDAASRVRGLRPEFAARQAVGAKALLEVGRIEDAREAILLGLAVSPRDLELLDLRRRVR